MQHSNKIGGSKATRIKACPYSMLAPKHPMPASPFAEEGSYLHDVMEAILLGDIDENLLLEHPGMTEELLLEKINPALDAFDDVTDHFIPEGEDWEDFLPEAEYHFTGELKGCFGTTDFIGRFKDLLVILDWKFGDGVPVEAEDSDQGKFYCGAAMDSMPSLFKGIKRIAFVIVQPRRGYDCEPDIWMTDPAAIKADRVELITALELAEGPNPPMQEGDHCRFCEHKPLCPKINSMVSTALMAQPDAMSIEELGKAATQVKAIEQYAKDIMKLLQAVLDEGGDVPGWKLVAKRADRKWTDTEAVEKKLKNLKMSLTECKDRPKLKSPAKVEKIFKEAEKDFSKLSTLIEKKSSGNTIAPESDKRPAVEVLPKQLDELAQQLAIK